jgi:hypothetical protein
MVGRGARRWAEGRRPRPAPNVDRRALPSAGDSAKSALVAGLRYVHDTSPGIRRQRSLDPFETEVVSLLRRRTTDRRHFQT